MIPRLPTAVFLFLLVYPDVVDRLLKNRDGLDFPFSAERVFPTAASSSPQQPESDRCIKLEIMILILDEIAISHSLSKYPSLVCERQPRIKPSAGKAAAAFLEHGLCRDQRPQGPVQGRYRARSLGQRRCRGVTELPYVIGLVRQALEKQLGSEGAHASFGVAPG